MKIACLQLAPEMGKGEANMRKADEILSQTQPGELDLLVLPEMAFSGYNFPSLEAITPFLEFTTSGPSTKWAIATAIRLRVSVTIGYPEKTTSNPSKTYNALVTVSPSGEIVANYRKSFLYYTDETWASEGDAGFYHGSLGSLGPACMGICMDINPYRFASPWTEYEFATHCVNTATPLVILSMAWLTRLTPQELLEDAGTPDLDTLTYWIERFLPVVSAQEMEMIVVLANRCGTEPGNIAGATRGLDDDDEDVVGYAGSSAVLRIKNGTVQLYDILGRSQQKTLVVDTAQPPKYSLRQRTSA